MRYLPPMTTTVALADDVVEAAREIATHDGRPLGDVVSDLVRQALERRPLATKTRNGFPTLPRRGVTVTIGMVNALRDEEW